MKCYCYGLTFRHFGCHEPKDSRYLYFPLSFFRQKLHSDCWRFLVKWENRFLTFRRPYRKTALNCAHEHSVKINTISNKKWRFLNTGQFEHDQMEIVMKSSRTFHSHSDNTHFGFNGAWWQMSNSKTQFHSCRPNHVRH